MDTKSFQASHPKLKTVELLLTDPGGLARGKWAPVSTLEKAFGSGVNFPLSLHGLDVWGNEVAQTGLHIESGDLDGFNIAASATLTPVPWPNNAAVAADAETAMVLLHTLTPDRKPFGGCARTVLAAQVQKLAAKDRHPVCAFELEFHLLAEETREPRLALDTSHVTSDAQYMYGLEPLAEHAPVFEMIRKAAQWADLPVDTMVKEAGPNQYEVNLLHRNDPLQAADDVILLKRIVIEAARAHGLRATFMAKPFIDQPGNGMHVHASLLNGDGENIFADPTSGEQRLRHATAGLLATMREMTLVFINTRNGFRRMAEGSYAPTRTNWGENNRSVALRLPAAPPEARRVEHRVAGADANPYLVLAAILAGIDEGLDAGIEPPPPLVGNAYDPATPNRGESLPERMASACDALAGSGFAARALGEEMVAILTAIKRAEAARFEQDISQFEMSTYL
ncbi:MAG: glutamine synthetase family protein [Pseudomonadota bacterium]